MKLTSFSKSL